MATATVPLHNDAGKDVGMSQERLDLLRNALIQRLADAGGGKPPAVHRLPRMTLDSAPHSQTPTLQHLQIAVPLVAEVEALAHMQFPGRQGALQFPKEGRGRKLGQFPAEGNDPCHVHTRLLEGGQTLGQGHQELGSILGRHHHRRVRIEGDHHGRDAQRPGIGAGQTKNGFVPSMDAVEDAQGHDRGPEHRGRSKGVAPDLHHLSSRPLAYQAKLES